MIDSATLELLRSMKLSAMASELKKQLEDPVTYGNLGFEERIALLVDAEWAPSEQIDEIYSQREVSDSECRHRRH